MTDRDKDYADSSVPTAFGQTAAANRAEKQQAAPIIAELEKALAAVQSGHLTLANTHIHDASVALNRLLSR